MFISLSNLSIVCLFYFYQLISDLFLFLSSFLLQLLRFLLFCIYQSISWQGLQSWSSVVYLVLASGHFIFFISLVFPLRLFLINKARNKLRLKHQWIFKTKCFHRIIKFKQFSDVCLKKRRSNFCPVIRSLGNLLFIKTSWGHSDHFFLHETEYDRDNFYVNYDYCHISYM